MNLTEDIAIDLGTANTLIIHNDKVVVNEPSIVAMETKLKIYRGRCQSSTNA